MDNINDKSKEEIIGFLKKANQQIKRREKKWKRIADRWKAAFQNACQNQLRDNDVYRRRIAELEKALKQKD